MLRDIFFIVIGMNIGIGIGWILCKKFREDIKELMEFINGD